MMPANWLRKALGVAAEAVMDMNSRRELTPLSRYSPIWLRQNEKTKDVACAS